MGAKGSKPSKSKREDALSPAEPAAKNEISASNVSSKDSELKLTDEEDIDQTQSQIIDCMYRLNSTIDFFCTECILDIGYLLSFYFEGSASQRNEIGDLLAYLGVTDLFQRIWLQSLEMGFLNDESTLEYAVTTSILSLVHNYTEASSLLCFQVFESDLPNILLSYLRSATVSSYEAVLNSVMGILHNVLQNIPVSNQRFREQKAVDVFQRFRSHSIEMVSFMALVLQGYVITEDENERINSDDRDFIFMKEILEIALDPDNCNKREISFRPIEVILALNRLAVNDKNKERIVNAGLLPFYVQLLQPGCSEEEQSAAVEGLWTLMFKCWSEVANEPGCAIALQNLTFSDSYDVRRHAEGALWKLEDSKAKLQQHYHGSKPEDGRLVFISYQYGSQSTARKLANSLKQAGYNVWIDIENKRSALEDMKKALEKAAVVIICLTERYKDSPICRTEAEYSVHLNREILPLLLQPRYYPDGWLGALIGSRPVFDFSCDENYDQSLQNLIKSLGDRGKAAKDEDDQNSEVTSKKKTQSSREQDSNPSTWSTEEVVTWLKKNRIDEFHDWVHDFDGSLLIEYKYMLHHAPDMFYSLLKDKKVSPKDILKLCKALRQL